MLQRTFIVRDREAAARVAAFVQANVSPSRPLAVVVTEPRARRSLEQNDALHAIIREIAREAYVDGKQYSASAWKEFFRERFIPGERVELPDGRAVMRQRSTTELSVAEMSELIEAIRAYAAHNLGLELA